jgi:hypothetical protein
MPARPAPSLALIAAILGTSANPCWASLNSAGSGLDALRKRVGPGNEPTGAGVIVAQVEAGPVGAYGPDQADGEFVGKSFIEVSGPGGAVYHGTEVGRNLYGLATSIAPSISQVYLYTAEGWINNDQLRVLQGSSFPPVSIPAGLKVINNSWIGSLGGSSGNNDALRRADWLCNRDQVLMVNGVNNTNPNFPLMAFMYNGISVGMLIGGHGDGDASGVDGAGRQKPEIVAPGYENGGGPATSWSTGVVSGAAALMIETARTELGPGNPNGESPIVVKAVLLCGADHEDVSGTWTNSPIDSGASRGLSFKPLDDQAGAGELNVDRSHMILTAGEFDASPTPPVSGTAPPLGWDLVPQVDANASWWWRFDVNQTADEVAILATWNRHVLDTFTGYINPNFNLVLWRVDEMGGLVSLLGDENAAYFSSGNVVCQSVVDNVEHLYIRDLAPGNYVLELDRTGTMQQDFDVAVAWRFPVPPAIPGDLDGDGEVDVNDLLELLGAWGACPGCHEDIDGNGAVNVADLLILLANWSG